MALQIILQQAGNETRDQALAAGIIYLYDTETHTVKQISTGELGRQALAKDPEKARKWAQGFPGFDYVNGQLVQVAESKSADEVPRERNFSDYGVQYLKDQGIDLNTVSTVKPGSALPGYEQYEGKGSPNAIYAQGQGGSLSLDELLSSQGKTGQVSTATTQGGSNSVNTAYQKYFGRDATPAEMQFWSTRPASELETQLQGDYTKASGVSYDGSPITQGNQKTNKQLGIATPVPTPVPAPGGGTNTPPGTTPPPKTMIPGTNIESTGKTDLDALISVMNKGFAQMAANGQYINPTIELDPETKLKLAEEAASTIDPYYQNLFKVVKDKLTANMDTLKRDYQYQMQTAQENFKKTLDTNREDMAGAGLTFSGVRGKSEQNLSNNYQRQLDFNAANLTSSLNSGVKEAEQLVGSHNLSDLGLGNPFSTPSTVTTAGTGAFTDNRNLDLYQPTGNTTGSLEFENISARDQKYSSLEENKRRQLIALGLT